jgi:hypothetical protein
MNVVGSSSCNRDPTDRAIAWQRTAADVREIDGSCSLPLAWASARLQDALSQGSVTDCSPAVQKVVNVSLRETPAEAGGRKPWSGEIRGC